jgi:hypothetical protein
MLYEKLPCAIEFQRNETSPDNQLIPKLKISSKSIRRDGADTEKEKIPFPI